MPEIPEGEKVKIKLSHLHNAQRKLSRNKAPGTDLMQDSFIKSNNIFDSIKHELRHHFQSWFDGEMPPEHFRTSKVFILSKEPSCYPTKPNIRCIMMQNMMTKMLELVL